MGIKIRIKGIIIIFLIISSCKNDGSTEASSSGSESAAEKEWLKDYTSPEEKWGFINSQGKEVIEPMYDDVRDFGADGWALANKGGRWGFIDKNNTVKIPFAWLDAHPFAYDLALVQSFDRRYHYINRQGQVQYDCPGEECQSFRGGFAVYVKNNLKGLIGENGQVVLPAALEEIIVLNGNLIIAKAGEKYGLADIKGNWKMEADFEKIYPSTQPYLRAKKGGSYYYIDPIKFKIVSKSYEAASDFYDGKAMVKNGDYQIIDKDFKTLYQTPNALKFGGGGFWIEEKNGQFRFVQSQGEVISEQWYDALYPFQEGLAGFQKGEFWGYLDADGNEVIPATLPLVWSASEGKIRFIDQGGYGFITIDKNLLVEPKYLEARDFIRGYARIAR